MGPCACPGISGLSRSVRDSEAWRRPILAGIATPHAAPRPGALSPGSRPRSRPLGLALPSKPISQCPQEPGRAAGKRLRTPPCRGRAPPAGPGPFQQPHHIPGGQPAWTAQLPHWSGSARQLGDRVSGWVEGPPQGWGPGASEHPQRLSSGGRTVTGLLCSRSRCPLHSTQIPRPLGSPSRPSQCHRSWSRLWKPRPPCRTLDLSRDLCCQMVPTLGSSGTWMTPRAVCLSPVPSQ